MKGTEVKEELKETKKSHWKMYVITPIVAAAGYVVWRFGLSKEQKEKVGQSALSAVTAVFSAVVNFIAIKLNKDKNQPVHQNH